MSDKETDIFPGADKEAFVAPPPAVWDRVEETLREKKKRRFFWIIFLVGLGSSAAGMIALYGIVPSGHTSETTTEVEAKSTPVVSETSPTSNEDAILVVNQNEELSDEATTNESRTTLPIPTLSTIATVTLPQDFHIPRDLPTPMTTMEPLEAPVFSLPMAEKLCDPAPKPARLIPPKEPSVPKYALEVSGTGKFMIDEYEKLTSSNPNYKSLHTGLELGVLKRISNKSSMRIGLSYSKNTLRDAIFSSYPDETIDAYADGIVSQHEVGISSIPPSNGCYYQTRIVAPKYTRQDFGISLGVERLMMTKGRSQLHLGLTLGTDVYSTANLFADVVHSKYDSITDAYIRDSIGGQITYKNGAFFSTFSVGGNLSYRYDIGTRYQLTLSYTPQLSYYRLTHPYRRNGMGLVHRFGIGIRYNFKE